MNPEDVYVVVDLIPDPHRPELLMVRRKLAVKGDKIVFEGEDLLNRLRVQTREQRAARDLTARPVLNFDFTPDGTTALLGVDLVNAPDGQPVEIHQVLFESDYEAPQPYRPGVEKVGGMYSMHAEGGEGGPLGPGEARRYFLAPQFMGEVRSLVASLDPGQ
jgi:hypothetical protein